MDAEQRSVFQGIVYYYRENMVNCRYQVTLKDAVDGALLQQALDAARAKAPYYFQKPVWEKKLLHLEPSDAPCPVRQGSEKPEFPDENGFTVALSYEGKAVYFDWFHFLTDGQCVHHAQCKGVVLCHYNVIELFFHCKAHHGIHIGGLDVLALGIIADAAVARCAPDLAAVGALFQCLDDGVLAAAAAHYQDFFSHIIHLPVFE